MYVCMYVCVCVCVLSLHHNIMFMRVYTQAVFRSTLKALASLRKEIHFGTDDVNAERVTLLSYWSFVKRRGGGGKAVRREG